MLSTHLATAAAITLTPLQHILTVLSGLAVGFTLGLIGGGGSVLAVPLLLYLVGYPDPHVVIGTTALAVSVNAYINLVPHARAGNVRWREAVMFALIGALAAFVGSTLGKLVDGHKLLFLFALVMLVIATLMVRRRDGGGDAHAQAAPFGAAQARRLAVAALLVGLLSGFFGIGGGFLIVPGLVLSTGMPMLAAVGTSLVSVGTFGLTTALNYARSGLLDWSVAAQYIGGGIIGGWIGTRLANHLGRGSKGALNLIFAGLVAAVAVYMLARNLQAIGLHL